MERMGEFFVANGITEDRKHVAVFLSSVGPSTYRLLKNLLAPSVPSSKSLKDITDALKNHFEPKPLVIAERFKFHQRSLRAEETVTQYLSELRKPAKTCDFKQFLDEALRDRFEYGLREQSIQKRLLSSEDGLDVRKALTVAQGMEAAELNSKQIHEKPVVHGVDKIGTGQSKNMDSKKTVEPSLPCPRCGEFGHWASTCWFRTTQCKKCGKIGHIARACRSRNTRNHREIPPNQESLLTSWQKKLQCLKR